MMDHVCSYDTPSLVSCTLMPSIEFFLLGAGLRTLEALELMTEKAVLHVYVLT